MVSLDDELAVTLETIRRAGAEVMRRYESFEKIEDAPADISTDADRASQELILNELAQRFPDDALCGEESTPDLVRAKGLSDRRWIVDPIDGTRGFARKNDEFSIMIALTEKGQPIVGAVYEPSIDRVTYAASGGGCYYRQPFDGQPVRCSVRATSSMSEAIFSISRSQKEEGKHRILEAFGIQSTVMTYSAGIKFAQVARGETDVYVGDYLTLKDWDVAAGHILVIEAGGSVSSVDGDPVSYDGTGGSLKGRGIIGTNGPLHEQVVSTITTGKYVFK